MCLSSFTPEPPPIPKPPPPPPKPLAFIPGSADSSMGNGTGAIKKTGKSSLISDGVGLGIPTGG